MFTSKLRSRIVAVYFIALAFMMYYSQDRSISIPYTIALRQVFVVCIIFSGFVCFLVRPNIARASVAIRSAFAFAAPMFVMIVVSLPIWFTQRASTSELFQEMAILVNMNQLLAALAAATFLYMFGEIGIWYNLVALVLANLAVIVTIMAEHGVGAYLRELGRLITSFAGNTGDIIVQAEVHEMAFCMGVYLTYMLLHFRKDVWYLCLMILSAFCFVSAFKRIAMAAIAVAFVVGIIFKFLKHLGKERTIRICINLVWVGVCVLLLLYIPFVKEGGFHLLEDIGLDTMSRAEMYDAVDDYYTFSPDFVGHGTGWIFYQLTNVLELWENAIHNDYLQIYIDLGFWGYILWMFTMTYFRTSYFGRKGQIEDRINTFSIMCYILILSTTDNTMYYQLMYTVSGIVIMGHTFDRQVLQTDQRLFGVVEEQNRILEKKGAIWLQK